MSRQSYVRKRRDRGPELHLASIVASAIAQRRAGAGRRVYGLTGVRFGAFEIGWKRDDGRDGREFRGINSGAL